MQDPRWVALSVLGKIQKDKAYGNIALDNALKTAQLEPKDRAFAARLVYGVLQNRLLLEYYIAHFSSVKLKKIHHSVLNILLIAAYSILMLDKIPDSAAVNQAVLQTKKANPKSAGFVNAVLRKLAQEKANLPEITGEPDRVLSIKYSHPLPLVQLLISDLGFEQTELFLNENNQIPPTVFRVNTLKTTQDELLKLLPEGRDLMENCISITGADLVKGGFFDKLLICDTASQLAVMAADPRPGQLVLDCCAAPGGKSLMTAVLTQNRAQITGCDLHENKLGLIGQSAKRLGANITTRQMDATQFCPEFEDKFDLVIADVPCSGLGVIRKKPDIRYKDIDDFGRFSQISAQILDNVSRYVKKGGRLLFSTCTVLSAENEKTLLNFLERHGEFALKPFELPIAGKTEGYITLMPQKNGTDGFFIGLMERA